MILRPNDNNKIVTDNLIGKLSKFKGSYPEKDQDSPRTSSSGSKGISTGIFRNQGNLADDGENVVEFVEELMRKMAQP